MASKMTNEERKARIEKLKQDRLRMEQQKKLDEEKAKEGATINNEVKTILNTLEQKKIEMEKDAMNKEQAAESKT